MAKKFVRGVTGVDDIEKFDKSLTNVNDLISDGKNTYVHTKKGKNEFYYNITNAINKVQSNDNTLTITKENDTVSIANNTLATKQELATKENTLSVDYGISKTTSGNTSKLGIEYTKVPDGFDLNVLTSGFVRGYSLTNAPSLKDWYFVETFSEGAYSVQKATPLKYPNTPYLRTNWGGQWTEWREQIGEKSVIYGLLAQKQNKIVNNGSIAPSGDGLRQVLTDYQTYTHTNGVLKTYSKWVSSNTQPETHIFEEAYFTVKINKGATSATFTLNDVDNRKFNKIMTSYGQNNTVHISGCIFTLSGSDLTVTTANNVDNNYVITFSNII